MINARVDSFFTPSSLAESDRRGDAIRRGQTYRAAGADCVFVPGATADDLREIVPAIDAPINAGLPLNSGSLEQLRAIGVARVSVGPQLYRGALAHIRTELLPVLGARG